MSTYLEIASSRAVLRARPAFKAVAITATVALVVLALGLPGFASHPTTSTRGIVPTLISGNANSCGTATTGNSGIDDIQAAGKTLGVSHTAGTVNGATITYTLSQGAGPASGPYELAWAVTGGAGPDWVYVKGGPDSHKYTYSSPNTFADDSKLVSPHTKSGSWPEISNFSFCYGPAPATGTISIRKLVTGTGALTGEEFNFDGAIDEDLSASEGATSPATVLTGTHTVTEMLTTAELADGWSLTKIECSDETAQSGASTWNLTAGTATFNVQAGETLLCDFTNHRDLRAPTATAKANKKVTGTNAPPITGWTIQLKKNGTVISEVSSNSDPADFQTFQCPLVNPTGACDLGAGDYTIEEVGADAGGIATSASAGGSAQDDDEKCSFTVPEELEVSVEYTCEFTNHRDGQQQPPCCFVANNDGTLIVEKQTLPDGAAQTFTFSGAALGTGGASLGDGQSTSRTVGPGTYTVSELQPDGWDLTSITCTDSNTAGSASSGDVATSTATFRVDANETVRCVFTNTEEPDDGTIVVTKQTLPDGATEDFGFAGALSGDISDGESLSATVDPGTYIVAEHAADGWELTDISCTDSDATGIGSSSNLSERSATLNVDPGETVTCEFTNTEIEVLPRPPIVRTPEEPKVLPKPPEEGVLPFTGGDPGSFLVAAGLLIAVGGGLALGGRRRRRK